jgi:hypothetical protein
MKEAYKEVKRLLTEVADPSTALPLFRTVELDKGQMDRLVGENNTQGIVFFPAVFIRFNNITYSGYAEGIRRGAADMVCKIVLHDVLGIEDEEIFKYRDILDNTIMDGRNTLNALSVADINYEEMPPSYNNTIEWVVSYRIGFIDNISYKYRYYVNANDPKINPEAPVKYSVLGEIKEGS